MKLQYKSIIKLAILAGLWLPVVTSCSEEDLPSPVVEEGYSPDTQLVISLAVPRQDDGDDGDADASRAQMKPQGAEGKINDLRLLAFGYDGGTAVVNRMLPFGSSDVLPIDPNGFATFEIKGFTPGKYAVYIVANKGEELADVTNEQQLKQKLNDYSNSLPAPGNLLMVYEPGARIEINKAGTEPAMLEASMKIAAVKVRYNIIFDKRFAGDIFGDAGLRITSVKVDNVAKRSYVVANTADTDPGLRSINAGGAYYTSYTENQANASADNADVINVSGNGSSTTAYASTWVYRGDLYLPERYVASDGVPTTMKIEGVVTGADGADGNVTCKYAINLAAYDGAPNEKSMPRGNYYEVVGKVKTLGEAHLDASIQCKDWSESILMADIVHTYLDMKKTALSVASLAPDSVEYATDGRGAPQFACADKLQNKPVVKGEFVTRNGKKYLRLEVNPEVDVTQLTDAQAVGTATCSLTAGNICKQIKVAYDIKPFFYVTPVANKIQWSDSQPENRKKRFHYVTNLGGVLITDKDNQSAIRLGKSGNTTLTSYTYVREIVIEGEPTRRSHVKLTCANPTAAEGDIYAEALYNPGTTQVHEFDFCPLALTSNASKYSQFVKNGKVTVMKPYGDYRIYFRAINDWHKFDGGAGNTSGPWLEGADPMTSSLYPTEYTGIEKQNNNWIDYWYCASQNDTHAWGNAASNNRYPYEDSHNIYIWTQLGETYSWQDTPKVWRFTGEYKYRNPMKGDFANPGWYYYDLPVDQNPKGTSGGADGIVHPEPGTTLMIFNNHTNAGDQGFTVHRVAHHLMPGISLFDYEDHEGWVLYDPTTEGLYRTYDERPVIKDVTYNIYSDAMPTGWWRKYGVAQENPPASGTPAQYTIYSNNVASRKTVTINGKTYYLYQIKMKAVEGEHAKAININFEGTSGGTTTQPAPQRIYYYNTNGWSNLRVYIYKDAGGFSEYTSWDNAKDMIKGHSENGYDYYYYDVPSGYENGKIVFRSGSNQVPSNGQNFALEGKTKCYKPATGSWSEFTAPPITVTTPSGAKVSSKLFGGRQFPEDTGYFNSATGTWSAGAPK